MSREAILYVGLHKTASSSIQATCARNAEWLHAAGFEYPTYAIDGREQVNHSQLLRNMFRRDPQRLGLDGQFASSSKGITQGRREKLKAKIASTLAASKSRVILAAEGLSIFSAEELTALKEWLLSAGFRPRVICHVRHISSWLNSIVAQRVRGQMGLTIAEAVQELVHAGGLVRPRIETIRSVFPETQFFSHELAVAHPQGPPGFFLETIGLRDTAGVHWKRVNEGASDLTTRMLSRVNERFGRAQWKGTPEEFGRFIDQPGLIAIQNLRGEKFRMLQSEASPLAGLIASENAWLRDRFGPQFHDPDPTFAAEISAPSAQQVDGLAKAMTLCEPQLRNYLASAD